MSKHRHWTFINKPSETVPGRNRPGGAGQPGRRRGADLTGPGRLAPGKTKASVRPAGPEAAEAGLRGGGETAGSPADMAADLKDGGQAANEAAGYAKDRVSAEEG